MTSIFDLELHKTISVSHGLSVTRVPGGWLYETRKGKESGVCFVPYVTEHEHKQHECPDCGNSMMYEFEPGKWKCAVCG